MNAEPELRIPIITAAAFAALLPAPGMGEVMVLASAEPERLEGAMVAARRLLERLSRLRIHAMAMSGVAPVTGIDAVGAMHERRWLAVGDLCERLLAHHAAGSQAPALVVYADPWSANLDETVRRHWPAARRVLIDDLIARVAQDAESWQPVITWLAAKEGLRFLPSHDLITWAETDGEGVHAVVEAIPEAFAGRWTMVLDEHGGHPPAPGVLTAALACGEPLALISPHLPWYFEHHQPLLARCAAAWRPDELAATAYRAVLSGARRYLAPDGPPFGRGMLAALPAGAEAWLPENGGAAASGMTPRWQLHSFSDREDLRQRLTGASRAAPAPIARAETAAASASDPLQAWWRGLGGLVTADATPVAAAPSAPVPAPMMVADSTVEQEFDFAFLACCFKYLQRFRICIDSIARQSHPLERIEVCVAAPGNPDGFHEYVALVRMVHPRLTIRVLDVPEELRGNKGKMLNLAFRASRARVVMPTDVDIVFPPDFVQTMLARHLPGLVLGCWRTPLAKELTAQILVGNLDPVQHFAVLAKQWSKEEETGGVRQGMLGYCQVVAREAFAAIGYPEDFEGFGQSDIVFIDRLRERAGVTSQFMQDYHVLHLSHSRDWAGTKVHL